MCEYEIKLSDFISDSLLTQIIKERNCVKNKSSPEKENNKDVISFKKKLKESIKSNPKVENFLKKEHAYGRFISAVSKQGIKRNQFERDFILNCIKSSNHNGFINGTLCWSETTEGYYFWKNLNRKFMEEQTELPI